MTEKHTQWRLIYWPDRNGRLQVGPSTNYTVAEMCITPLEGQDANARRLVACWNACEGIDTDVLEDIERSDSQVATAARILNVQLLRQRDELLAALEKAEEWLTGWASAEPYLSYIRAAIAKGKGRPT